MAAYAAGDDVQVDSVAELWARAHRALMGHRKTILRGGTWGRYLPSGHLVYVNDGTLLAAGFDLDRMADFPAEPARRGDPFIESLRLFPFFDAVRLVTLLQAGGRPLRGVRLSDNFSRPISTSSRQARSSRSSSIIFRILTVPLPPTWRMSQIGF
jgi:hypothetical protein